MAVDLSDVGRRIIDFDPAHPEARFFSTATQLAAATSAGLRADPVQFPPGLAPTLNPPAVPPDPSAPLPRADVVVVTWTAAEADTLAILLTPGVAVGQWFEYKSNLDHYLPLVNGPKAPFNDPSHARYYHSLGIYYPISLVGKNVLCFKSGLHLDYDTDSPPPVDLPLMDLWKQIIKETGAELIITTGTGGAVGANVLLGDVVIAAQTVFDCTKQFAAESFHNSSYSTSPLPTQWAPPAATMLKDNAERVAQSNQPSHSDELPAFYYSGSVIPVPKIVTTDSFLFDNTTDTNGLQALGNACDMGDASLGLVISDLGANAPRWAAIRNASDPQIDGTLSPSQQSSEAYTIYTTYGALTTAASVLAAWSLICAYYAQPQAIAAGKESVEIKPEVSLSLVKSQQEVAWADPSHLLMQIAAGSNISALDVPNSEISRAVANALADHLRSINIDMGESEISWRKIRFVDETRRQRELTLAQVSRDDTEAFRGSYLLLGTKIIAKTEFASD